MRKNLLKNKKGFLEDWSKTPILIFGAIFTILVLSLMFYHLNNTLQSSSLVDSSTKNIIESGLLSGINTLDNVVFYLYIGIILFVLVGSYFVQSNIKLAIIGILFFLLSVWALPFLSEFMLHLMTNNAEISVVSDLMPKTSFIINNMLMIQIIFFVVAALVFYSKNQVSAQDEAI